MNRRIVKVVLFLAVFQGLVFRTSSYAHSTPSVPETTALSLPDGKVGQSYEYQLQTEGGLAPLTWKVVGGELPPGIRLEASGKFIGTPTSARRDAYSFVVEVADSSQQTQRLAQPFMLAIQAPSLRILTNKPALRITSPLAPPSHSLTAPNPSSPTAVNGPSTGAENGNANGAVSEVPASGNTLVSGTTGNGTGIANSGAAKTMDVPDVAPYDWGKVRAYFSGMAIFSKEREEFSKQDIGLGFNIDKAWAQWGQRFHINTFFEGRLTAIPVNPDLLMNDTENASEEGEGGGGEGDGDEDTATTSDFTLSKKAALLQVGLYLPIFVSKWAFNTGDPDEDKKLNKDLKPNNAIFIAPIAKVGIQSITNGTVSEEAKLFGADDVYNFGSVGIRIGHVSLPKDYPDKVSPEMNSYLDITRGRWENFELLVPAKDGQGNDIRVRQRQLRWGAEGRFKVPDTPFIVGFDGNFGKGPDDLRFLFGMRFDIGKIIGKLKLLEKFGVE
jgi:hypothetical protein